MTTQPAGTSTGHRRIRITAAVAAASLLGTVALTACTDGSSSSSTSGTSTSTSNSSSTGSSSTTTGVGTSTSGGQATTSGS